MKKTSSASKIKLDSYGSLFGNREVPTVYKVGNDSEQVVELPLAKLYSFTNHPFKVIDDEKMDELVESIKANGVLVPGIVRKINEDEYELISGHRRKHASELAGKETMPVFVKELSDEESTVIMVDANIQREEILPSEKAKAYSMKYEALKHQGVKGEGNTLEMIGEATGDNAKKVQRYIQLARLNDELLEMVDHKELGFIQGTEISMLQEEQQQLVYDVLCQGKYSMSKEQAVKIKEYGKRGELTNAVIELILTDSKPRERKIVIKNKTISNYFTDDISESEIEKVIIQLLEDWKNRQ